MIPLWAFLLAVVLAFVAGASFVGAGIATAYALHIRRQP